jgi:hypothetical protein
MKMLKIVSAVLGITASTGGCGIEAKTVVTIATPICESVHVSRAKLTSDEYDFKSEN